MEIDITPLVSSCVSSNFVGRKKVTDEFYEWLNDMTIMKQPRNQWVHISGAFGSGRSSLLQKFKEMAIAERVRDIEADTIYFPMQFQDMLAKIFTRIDEIAPEWRSFLQRRTKAPFVEFPQNFSEQLDGGSTDELRRNLLKNFPAAIEKLESSSTIIGVFMDDIDNVLRSGGKEYYDFLISLIEKISSMTKNIFFVTTSKDKINTSSEMTHLELDAFDVNDGELMIRRRVRLDKDDREEITMASSRLPFDLALRTELFLQGHDFRVIEMENLVELFGLEENEVELFIKLATEEENFFNKQKYEEKYTKKVISTLVQSGFFKASEEFLTVASNSMWELISTFFLPTDVRTELLLIVQRIADRVSDGNLPSVKELAQAEQNLNQIKDVALLYEVSGKLNEISEMAIENEIIYTAWQIIQLTNSALQRTGDKEKLAEMNEKFAFAFGKTGHEYYAAQLFHKAAELFKSMGHSGKISAETNYREAGLRYRKEAERMDLKTFHYAMRSMYAKSIRAFLAADEQGSVNEVRRNALEVFKEYPEHQTFIREVEIKES